MLRVLHRVPGVLYRVPEVLHRVLGVLHGVLRVLRRVLGVLHRVLVVLRRVLGGLRGVPGLMKAHGHRAPHICLSQAPDAWTTAAERLGVSPQQTVVIDESLVGCAAGREGDFALVVGLARTVNARTMKQTARPHVTIPDLNGYTRAEVLQKWIEVCGRVSAIRNPRSASNRLW